MPYAAIERTIFLCSTFGMNFGLAISPRLAPLPHRGTNSEILRDPERQHDPTKAAGWQPAPSAASSLPTSSNVLPSPSSTARLPVSPCQRSTTTSTYLDRKSTRLNSSHL